jgi:DNA-directed RNA polymerase specialized sigma24 family protein
MADLSSRAKASLAQRASRRRGTLVLHATADSHKQKARKLDFSFRAQQGIRSIHHPQSTIHWDPDPELSLYRPRTLALLRRYLRISSAVGRLPSVIAREVFRAKVSHYRIHTFEESVIFVLDVERALACLYHDDQQVITRVVFQGHSHDSAARLLGWKRRTVTRALCEALDRLSELMLARGLLRKM